MGRPGLKRKRNEVPATQEGSKRSTAKAEESCAEGAGLERGPYAPNCVEEAANRESEASAFDFSSSVTETFLLALCPSGPEEALIELERRLCGGLDCTSRTTENSKCDEGGSADLLLLNRRLYVELRAIKESFSLIPAAIFEGTRFGGLEKHASYRFLNRAAAKLAALDEAFGFLPSCGDSSSGGDGVSISGGGGNKGGGSPFLFVDLCGGPGGFSQYLLRAGRARGLEVCGWGMTLAGAGSCDWCLDQILDYGSDCDDVCAPAPKLKGPQGKQGAFPTPEAVGAAAASFPLLPAPSYPTSPPRFSAFYGIDGTGDILNERNVRAFAAHVLHESCGRRPLLVAADGASAAVDGRHDQEALPAAARLALCQALAALELLAEGGHFVLKVFGTARPFNAGLIHALSALFRATWAAKPAGSRPANDERYLIFRGYVVCGGGPPPRPLMDRLWRADARLAALEMGRGSVREAARGTVRGMAEGAAAVTLGHGGGSGDGCGGGGSGSGSGGSGSKGSRSSDDGGNNGSNGVENDRSNDCGDGSIMDCIDERDRRSHSDDGGIEGRGDDGRDGGSGCSEIASVDVVPLAELLSNAPAPAALRATLRACGDRLAARQLMACRALARRAAAWETNLRDERSRCSGSSGDDNDSGGGNGAADGSDAGGRNGGGDGNDAGGGKGAGGGNGSGGGNGRDRRSNGRGNDSDI